MRWGKCGVSVGTVKLTLAVLHKGSTGKAGGNDFFPLELLGDFCGDGTKETNIWAGQHILSLVLGAVVIHVLIVDVVQHGRPTFLVLGYEVDELIGHDGHLVGLTDDTVGPSHEFHAGTGNGNLCSGVTRDEL